MTFSWNGLTLFQCFICSFKASHFPFYICWNPSEVLLHENCEFSFTRRINPFLFFNLKKNMRSITQQTYVLHLTKGFAFLLTDPASQDFLDPKVLRYSWLFLKANVAQVTAEYQSPRHKAAADSLQTDGVSGANPGLLVYSKELRFTQITVFWKHKNNSFI